MWNKWNQLNEWDDINCNVINDERETGVGGKADRIAGAAATMEDE